jgi:cytochrome c oxidase subunit I+III
VGLRDDRREVLVTSALDAVPELRYPHPVETIWPLVMAVAVGVTFIGAVFTPWAYVVGFTLGSIAFAGWAWPGKRNHNADPRVKGTRVPKPA